MGGLRLHAIGIDEFRGLLDPEDGDRAEVRAVLEQAFIPVAESPRGLLGRLRRGHRQPEPADPLGPGPADIETFLSGDTFLPQRLPAAWRLLEAATQRRAWGSTRLALTSADMDQLDFALARGGVSAAVGLRHLFSSATHVSLIPVHGLTVGWHDNGKALAMAQAYRDALDEVPPEHQHAVTALVDWMDGFPHWAEAAASVGRPAPDLVGFWSE